MQLIIVTIMDFTDKEERGYIGYSNLTTGRLTNTAENKPNRNIQTYY